ncbi:MAG: uL4 family ribosomal protein, partial [Spirochaetes bacterium]|nr:uL4 family ribosomal protein [Spirochaetota bacterium]
KIPKKIKNLAYRSVLSLKMKEDNVVIFDEIKLESAKTKELNSMLKDVISSPKAKLVVTSSENDLLIKRAGKNLPWLQVMDFQRLNVHALFYSDKLVFTAEAVKNLDNLLNKIKVEG